MWMATDACAPALNVVRPRTLTTSPAGRTSAGSNRLKSISGSCFLPGARSQLFTSSSMRGCFGSRTASALSGRSPRRVPGARFAPTSRVFARFRAAATCALVNVPTDVAFGTTMAAAPSAQRSAGEPANGLSRVGVPGAALEGAAVGDAVSAGSAAADAPRTAYRTTHRTTHRTTCRRGRRAAATA